jgi:DNA polymerase-3 subunit epsilon
MRQIVLDTETTGLEPELGHRIIEIGCVELVHRRPTGNNFHQYLQPDREIEEGAVEVHGITSAFLADKPRFQDVREDFVAYVRGAELIIHNAPFDVGFLDHELRDSGEDGVSVSDLCVVTDTLALARRMHPGQRNSLDALCKRYGIDNTHRDLHGALLDAEILADVYLAMTGGQTAFALDNGQADGTGGRAAEIRRLPADRPPLKVVSATGEELDRHLQRLETLAAGGRCLWREQEPSLPSGQHDS